ncbi:hypothetical protein AXG93_4542s1270 [Marchantia polymorpha subsp. ruderalis]|uniref:Uncharacterized protein n=1 Tax=Marchantia polymorpha subsp. ruderalis TaxID=1480154 RepID=A0A176W342_MARPO|nr:hypothetical protein AXG93_4542s1270 [Marchantia polymorpha subsp. ruderalis]
MMKTVSHLRFQYKLTDSMDITYPLLKDTCWESMHGMSDFMYNRRSEIIPQYAEQPQNAPALAFEPSILWWIINSAVSSLTLTVKNLTRSMQGYWLRRDPSRAGRRPQQGQHSRVQPVQRVKEEGRRTHQRPQLLMHSELPLLDEADKSNVVNCVGQLFMEVVEGMGQIVSLRDDRNDVSDQAIPPAVPQEYAELSSRELFQMVLLMKERLLSDGLDRIPPRCQLQTAQDARD